MSAEQEAPQFAAFYEAEKKAHSSDADYVSEIAAVEAARDDFAEERAQFKASTVGDKLYWTLRNLSGEEASYSGGGDSNRRRGVANAFGPPIEKSALGGTYQLQIIDSDSISLRLLDKTGQVYRTWDGRGKVSSNLRGQWTGTWS